NNPQEYELYKAARRSEWQQLKEQVLTKQIDSLNRRDKKAQRKNWRERSERYRMKKIMEGNAACIFAANQAINQPGLIEPHTPTHYPLSRISSGRNRMGRNRSKLVRTLKNVDADRYRSKYEKYKKRYQRLKLKTDKKEPSRRSRINRMIGKMRIS
ncbi:hypothetical protein HHI36_013475, partial [Cryptolaemus montrouzieri]